MNSRRKGQMGPRFIVYLLGLLIMALGIVFLIKADLGATPWDVLHVGLYYQVGLTIGSWSIIVGIVILTVATLISKQFPQFGAFLNMVLVGVFIDMYYQIPFFVTPEHLWAKACMFIIGMIVMCYGMGIYISAQFGAGPRDSLMIALTEKTGWKIRNVRAFMEIIVLVVGWRLGGPIFWGTILITFTIGPLVGITLPQCQAFTDKLLAKLVKEDSMVSETEKQANRGAGV